MAHVKLNVRVPTPDNGLHYYHIFPYVSFT